MTGIIYLIVICVVPVVGCVLCVLIEGTPVDRVLTALFPGGENQ